VKFPETGRAPGELLDELAFRKGGDVPWGAGRVFAYIYDAGPEAMQLLKDAYSLYLVENGLDPTSFPSCRDLERDIIGMALDLLRAPPGARGSFTSGGTESILLSVKTARDHARATRPREGIPGLVLPETAHPAFFKACAYFDVEPVVVPVVPETLVADPAAMEAAITDRSIMMVGSAPSYAHGVVDPIPELAAIAARRGLLMHVDCCVGGMYLPWVRRLGEPLPAFDFGVPGVTQVSMDFHKWGYAAKGASCILYREEMVWQHQLFAWSGWTGYTVVNSTIQSSKSGGPLAACWAVLNYLGEDGYMRLVAATQGAARQLREAVAGIEGLYVVGRPPANLLALAARDFDIFELADLMRARGWFIQPQFGFGPSPPNVHLSIGASNVPQMGALIADLRECVATLRSKPSSAKPVAPMPAEALAAAPAELFERLASAAGVDASRTPTGGMSAINNLLNGMPAPLRDGLIKEFLKRQYVPR
jgi:glutamate/tyrosine decarboxylase-like PLP-dependent enzyme